MTVRPVDRRSQIVAAALRLVARDGPALVTTRKIAREAEINLATLHYFFRSKDALLLDVLTEATGRMIAALARVAPAERGLQAGLVAVCQALLALADRDPSLPMVRCDLQLYLGRLPEHAEAAREQRQRYLAALVALHDGVCSPDERSASCQGIAELIASLVDGLAMQRAVLDGTELLQQTRDDALRAVFVLAVEHTSPGALAANGLGDPDRGERRARSVGAQYDAGANEGRMTFGRA